MSPAGKILNSYLPHTVFKVQVPVNPSNHPSLAFSFPPTPTPNAKIARVLASVALCDPGGVPKKGVLLSPSRMRDSAPVM